MEERNLNSNIILYEAKTEADIRRFRAELRAYHARDIFPGEEDREELAYFLGEEYRGQASASCWSSASTPPSGETARAMPAPRPCWPGRKRGACATPS